MASEKANGEDRDRSESASHRPSSAATPSHVRPEEGGRGSTSRDRSQGGEENAIRARKIRARAASEPSGLAQGERTDGPAGASTAQTTNDASSGKPDTDPWTVPASVRERFHQEGHRFYFPDGAEAFRDHGRKLSTPSENTEVIASLIEIAQARGWSEITVSGTDAFRQGAWREARLAGLTVRGYRPSEAERASLHRALAREREEGRAERVAHQAQVATPNGIAEPGDEARRGAPGSISAREGLILGKLIDHGRESFQFDPHQEISYFVRIETAQGKRTIWGKDLKRALESSLTSPKIGDEIGLQRTGADNVTVKHRVRDPEGNLLKETDLATHRNRWVIEKREFFEAREVAAQVLRDPKIEPKVAVKSHPQLAGTYLNLHAAEIASKRFRDPEDQKKFVAIVRGALADAVARGEPLQPVRLRERSGVRSPPERSGREPEASARA